MNLAHGVPHSLHDEDAGSIIPTHRNHALLGVVEQGVHFGFGLAPPATFCNLKANPSIILLKRSRIAFAVSSILTVLR